MENTKKIITSAIDFGFCFEKILDVVFRECPDGIIYKDKTFCYKAVNDAFCKCFKIKDKNKILGKKEAKFLSPENKKIVEEISSAIVRDHCPLSYVMSLNNDTNRILSVTSTPVFFENEFLGIITMVKDITQEEAIKENFVNKHFEHINSERKLQVQRETFIASLGHDLKNPTIAQIRGLELLLKGNFGEVNDSQKELLQMVLDSCRYMNGMLASLLATYRDYGGMVKLNFIDFSFLELVNECVSEMIYVAKDKGVNINIKKESSTSLIQADRVQIKRVVMNLLSNGIKYAFPNTELVLKIYDEDEKIGFEFLNESPYIPKEKQKAIFAQYVSYASAHNELGIGLGLYASKKIVEAHNGEIFVESYKNNRNSFGFRIPIAQKENNVDMVIHF